MSSVFDSITGQPHVTRFFQAAHAKGRYSHAYLFVGPQGSGRMSTALALAQALLCEEGGCGSCSICKKVARGTHPDLHLVEPEGVDGYLMEQVRDLIHDVSLAPVQAQAKVYIINRADLLKGMPANAFLKTIEEPPANVTFILIASTRESVLETLVSRCQVVAFRSIPDGEALTLVCSKTGATAEQGRIALSVTGSSAAVAIAFIRSAGQRQLRRAVIERLEQLPTCDSLSVLHSVRDLLAVLEQPQDEVKARQADETESSKEFLSKGALSALEKRHKRELSQKERESMSLIFACTRSWLRDCLVVSAGSGSLLVNTDCYSNIQRIAEDAEPGVFVTALSAVDDAERRLKSNVSSQLVLEAMLFEIKEALDA